MSGPIVRSGPSVKFSANWDKAFGKKKSGSGATKTVAKAKKKTAKKKK
jgi:hypothetical protein